MTKNVVPLNTCHSYLKVGYMQIHEIKHYVQQIREYRTLRMIRWMFAT